jgi:hypothetical protein
LFSVTNATIFPIVNPANAFYGHPSYGPYIGNGDIVISDGANANTGSYSEFGSAYSLPPGVTVSSVTARTYLTGTNYNF